MKNKKLIKRGFLVFAILVFSLSPLFFYYKTILIGTADYLAPERVGKADVVILEGDVIITSKAVKVGLNLLSSGKANFFVLVTHEDEGKEMFAIPDYHLLLANKLEVLGLKKKQFEIITTPGKHPITLTEAEIVLSQISKKGIKSAILITEGFHTRRSYWAYKRTGSYVDIEIIPCPYFAKYQKETWWQQDEGIRDYFEESYKFIYYLLRGYLPLKSLFVT